MMVSLIIMHFVVMKLLRCVTKQNKSSDPVREWYSNYHQKIQTFPNFVTVWWWSEYETFFMLDSILILHCFKPSITWTTFKQFIQFCALNATHTSYNMSLFAHHSLKASAVLSSLMFPVAGRIWCWLSRMLSYFKTLHALQEDGCIPCTYGIICLHTIHVWYNMFTYIPLAWKHTIPVRTTVFLKMYPWVWNM
jgi:hypothetical protein